MEWNLLGSFHGFLWESVVISPPMRMKAKMFASALFGLCFAASTQAATLYCFTQDGFDDGAVVTGWFVAEDTSGDGQISAFDGEVLDFSMDFSGNQLVPAFSAGIADLFGLVWDLGDPILGDGLGGDVEGIGVLTSDGYEYQTGVGPLIFPPVGLVRAPTGAESGSQNYATVHDCERVPSGGATLAMLGLGLAALGGFKRLVR